MGHTTKLLSAALVLMMLLVAGSVILSGSVSALPSGWSGGTIVANDQNRTATFSDCAVDSNNKLHVVYTLLDNSSGSDKYSLMYSDNTGGAWSTPVRIDNGTFSFLGSRHSIAVDSTGKTYITYATSRALKVATNAGGAWANTTIDSSSLFTSPAIVIDHNNYAHVSYFRYQFNLSGFETDIRHATNAGGTWTNETVATLPLGYLLLGTAIAVDSANHLSIAYVNYSALSGNLSGNITISSTAAGSWQSTQIDTSGNVLGSLALTIDHNNKDHLLYMRSTNLSDPNNGTLRYATNSGGAWTNESVVNLIGFAYLYGANIVVDSSNVPRISYVNVTLGGSSVNSNLTYFQTNVASRTGGSWSSTVAFPLSLLPSMAIDSSNNLYLVYLGYSSIVVGNSTGLLYATTGSAPVNTAPSAPNGFSVSAGNAQVALTWSAPGSTGGQAISGYKIYRGTTAATTTELTSVGASSFTYLDTSVTNGNNYYYQVAAVNSVGTGTATSALLAQPSATPVTGTAPGPVTNVNVQTDDGKVTVKWNAPTTGGAASYVLIYRATSNVQPSSPLANVSATSVQYVDTNVSNGVNYYYWVVPANANGSGTAATTGVVTPNSSSSNDNTLWIAIIVIIVIIIVVLALFMVMRRRKK